MELIVSCNCTSIPQKAMASFKLLFPGREAPRIYVGKDSIIEAARTDNQNLNKYLMAISKKSGQFAYYIKTNETEIVDMRDLLSGKKLG